MGYLSVILAGAAAWIFGAIWYGVIGKQWMAASGLTEESVNRKDPAPYIVSFVMAVVVAGMTRHILAGSGIDTIGKGVMTGLGLGLFVASPWMVTNIMFSMRPRSLIWMDCTYTVVGCGLIGLVLTMF